MKASAGIETTKIEISKIRRKILGAIHVSQK